MMEGVKQRLRWKEACVGAVEEERLISNWHHTQKAVATTDNKLLAGGHLHVSLEETLQI